MSVPIAISVATAVITGSGHHHDGSRTVHRRRCVIHRRGRRIVRSGRWCVIHRTRRHINRSPHAHSNAGHTHANRPADAAAMRLSARSRHQACDSHGSSRQPLGNAGGSGFEHHNLSSVYESSRAELADLCGVFSPEGITYNACDSDSVGRFPPDIVTKCTAAVSAGQHEVMAASLKWCNELC